MFLTDAQFAGYFLDMLNQPAGTPLQDWQVSISSQAHTQAYWDIVNAFTARGYQQAAINQWDRGAEFERSIGLWYALQEMARRAPDLYSAKAMDKTDRRPELKRVLLTIGGAFQQPATQVGQPVSGRRSGWHERCGSEWPRGV